MQSRQMPGSSPHHVGGMPAMPAGGPQHSQHGMTPNMSGRPPGMPMGAGSVPGMPPGISGPSPAGMQAGVGQITGGMMTAQQVPTSNPTQQQGVGAGGSSSPMYRSPFPPQPSPQMSPHHHSQASPMMPQHSPAAAAAPTPSTHSPAGHPQSPASSPAPPRTPTSVHGNITPTPGGSANPLTPGPQPPPTAASSLQQLEQMVMPSSSGGGPGKEAMTGGHQRRDSPHSVNSPLSGPKTPSSPSMRGGPGNPLSPQPWQQQPQQQQQYQQQQSGYQQHPGMPMSNMPPLNMGMDHRNRMPHPGYMPGPGMQGGVPPGMPGYAVRMGQDPRFMSNMSGLGQPHMGASTQPHMSSGGGGYPGMGMMAGQYPGQVAMNSRMPGENLLPTPSGGNTPQQFPSPYLAASVTGGGEADSRARHTSDGSLVDSGIKGYSVSSLSAGHSSPKQTSFLEPPSSSITPSEPNDARVSQTTLLPPSVGSNEPTQSGVRTPQPESTSSNAAEQEAIPSSTSDLDTDAVGSRANLDDDNEEEEEDDDIGGGDSDAEKMMGENDSDGGMMDSNAATEPDTTVKQPPPPLPVVSDSSGATPSTSTLGQPTAPPQSGEGSSSSSGRGQPASISNPPGMLGMGPDGLPLPGMDPRMMMMGPNGPQPMGHPGMHSGMLGPYPGPGTFGGSGPSLPGGPPGSQMGPRMMMGPNGPVPMGAPGGPMGGYPPLPPNHPIMMEMQALHQHIQQMCAQPQTPTLQQQVGQ